MWLTAVTVTLLWSGWELRRANQQLGALRTDLGKAAPANATTRLAAPKRSIHLAHRLLGSPVLAPLRAIPRVGHDLSTLTAATGRADDALAATQTLFTAASSLSPRNDCLPVERLPSLERHARRTLRQLRATRTAIAPHASLGFVERRLVPARRTVAALEQSARHAVDGIGLAMTVLGGSRHALLVVPTPVEARGSGGVIGSFVELSLKRGCVTFERIGRTTELNTGGLPANERTLPGDAAFVSRYSRFDAAGTWQNLTMSPDFASVGNAIAGLYPQSGGEPVDLVISLDPVALAAILGVVGPVHANGWPTPLTGANAVDVLQHDLYATVSDEATNLERVAVLGRVVDGVRHRLFSRPADPLALIGALARATTDRHVQLWSARTAEQQTIQRLGASGRLTPLDGDAVTVVTNNATASKLEWYLHRNITIRVHIDEPSGRVSSEVRVLLTNDAPSNGESDYIIGNDIGLPAGTSRLYVSLYSPLDLAGIKLNANTVDADEENELDRYVYSLWVDIPPGGQAEAVFTLRGEVPTGAYRLRVEQPPMIRPDHVVVEVNRAGKPAQRTVSDQTRLLIVTG